MGRKNTRVDKDFEKQPHEPAVADGESDVVGPVDDMPVATGPGYPAQRGVNLGAPSELASPNMSPEEQDMEMTAAVVGPPAYASPNPETNAGRLLPLSDHPLNQLEEGHPAAISEDYGKDHGTGETVDIPSPAEGGLTPQPVAPMTELERDLRGQEKPYENMTKAELYELAGAREIEGRSDMNKDELVEANKAYDEAAVAGTTETEEE